MHSKFKTSEINFNNYDSWALWEIPGNINEAETPREREKLFGESYYPNTFPMGQLPENMVEHLEQVKYVLVGLNPGTAGVSTLVNKQYLNFHGNKKSLDYRLAAALYETEVWGAFMTDLVHIDESDSRKVKAEAQDVAALERHLRELKIPSSAILIALGTKTHDILSKYATRKVEKIPHYSGANGHWRVEKTTQLVKALVANNKDSFK